MKRAFLVVGPESSGTRLMAKILEAGGCRRDNTLLWSDAEVVVSHRSVPHDGGMPDLARIVKRRRGQGYEMTAVIVVRDPFATMASQVKVGHSPDVLAARGRIQDALMFIFGVMQQTRCRFVLVPYEALVARPEAMQAKLFNELGLPRVPDVDVYDGNEKWYEETA